MLRKWKLVQVQGPALTSSTYATKHLRSGIPQAPPPPPALALMLMLWCAPSKRCAHTVMFVAPHTPAIDNTGAAPGVKAPPGVYHPPHRGVISPY